jgi:subtilisin family serine protease
MASRSRASRTAFLRLCLAASAAVAAACATAGPASAAPSSQQRFIVVLEEGVSPGKTAESHERRYGLKIGHVYRSALSGYSAVVPPGQLRSLRRNRKVEGVVRDARVTGMAGKAAPLSRTPEAADFGLSHIPENNLPPTASPNATPDGVPFTVGAPGGDGGDGGDETVEGAGKAGGGGGTTTPSGQVTPTGINRIDAELSSQVSGNGSGSVTTGVAVLDTGSGPHTDLNIAGGVNCVPRTKGTTDLQGHGTHIAGIIGAKDDGAGVVGVAPGARIFSVRVLGTSITGALSDLVCGLDWVAANGPALGIKVANLSLELTRTGASSAMDDDCDAPIGEPLHDAICRTMAKGVTIVAAAGNYTKDFANTIPAAYDDVLSVTAIADFDGLPGGVGTNPSQCEADGDDSSAAFSNWASDSGSDLLHTVAAPGRCLNSTWKGGGYNLQSGTSFAAPHAAGVAALCIANGQCAGLSPQAIVDRIYAEAGNAVAGFGFTDDPDSAIGGRWYGRLVSADPY